MGALIEDLDIRDLEAGLVVTERADIERVDESLLGGLDQRPTYFHAPGLEAEGVEYEVVYDSEDETGGSAATASGGGRGQQARACTT